MKQIQLIALTIIFSSTIFMPGFARAEEPAIRLEELIKIADQDNPDLKSARYRWQAAKKQILSSWALPDPQVGFDFIGSETETRVGSAESRVSVSQQIPFPLKLWEKRQVAKERAKRLEQIYFATRGEIINQLKQNYFALYWSDASIEAIDEVHEMLKKFEGAASARYANRSGAQRDVAKAQAEVSMTLEDLYELRHKREISIARLNVILNRGPFETFGRAEKPKLARVNETLIELVNYAIKNREEIKVSEAELEVSKHQATIAKLQNLPDVRVGFTYTWIENSKTGSANDGTNSWMIPVSLNVPLWQNRILPEIQAASLKAEAAEAELASASNEIVFQVKDAYYRYETASKIALLYETAVIPQAEIALNSDQAGYESGATDFLNLLDSERTYLNAKLTNIRIYTEALQSYAELERASGMNLTGEKKS